MPNRSAFVFSGLHLPRPLDAGMVSQFLQRLAADRQAPPLVMEVRADRDGTRHLLGCRPTDVHPLRRLLGDLLPGTVLTSAKHDRPVPRPAAEAAARLRVHPPGLALLTDTPEATSKGLLSALAAPTKADEHLVMQVVLGPRRAPRSVPAKVAAPDRGLVHLLLGGNQPASAETRNRMKDRLSQGGFAATVRVGAAASDRDRRRRFMLGVLSAWSTVQSPGTRIDLVRDSVKDVDDGQLPWRWPLHLAVAELVGLLGFPLGNDEPLPGMPPIHPKALCAAASVHTGPRVFAQSAAPGDDRLVGVAPADQMLHMINYGPSGSGKTNVALHLIMADIEAGRPVAVLDPKKQLVDDVLARVPDHRLNDVVVLDASDPSLGFNPLDVTGRDPDVVVDGIMAVFEAVFKDGWGPRTADIFSACLRTLGRASTAAEPATLLDLPRLLTDSSFRRQQVGRVQGDLALAGFWAWFDNQSPQAQAAAIAAPLNKLRQLLLRPALATMLDDRGGRFRLRNTFREARIVLVPLNEGLIGPGTAALLGSLVVADLWQATQERADDPNASQQPAMIYVDEAPRFLNLPVALADALAVSRSLSVGWFLAAQFRDQFPPALRQAVDHNARSKAIFAAEYEDARESAKLSRELAAEDFMALPRYHAYANLVADGHPSGWALVKTLPPPPPTTDPDFVWAVSRANFAAPPALPKLPTPSVAAPPSITTAAPPPPSPTPIGRKRRQR